MNRNHWIAIWLSGICGLIVAMVVIGGITRLTHSGLSMVEWNPIMGAIPPLSDSEWQDVFLKYQQFPEYKLLNHGMPLAEFKRIFFWEYLHRLVGRLIGVVLFVPCVVFWMKGWLDRRFIAKLGMGFLLGGLQGALGWFMVKSGLVDNPHVSHYRLAAHLLLAFGVLAYFFWMTLDCLNDRTIASFSSRPFNMALRGLTALILLQVIYGAFTAGLRAGFGYNTFPKMNGEWFPPGLLRLEPAFLNWVENPVTVQFAHRWVGWSLLFAISGFWFYSRKVALAPRQRLGVNLLMVMIVLQFILGVSTLLGMVPVSLASLHQLGACLLFLIALFLNHSVARSVNSHAGAS